MKLKFWCITSCYSSSYLETIFNWVVSTIETDTGQITSNTLECNYFDWIEENSWWLVLTVNLPGLRSAYNALNTLLIVSVAVFTQRVDAWSSTCVGNFSEYWQHYPMVQRLRWKNFEEERSNVKMSVPSWTKCSITGATVWGSTSLLSLAI